MDKRKNAVRILLIVMISCVIMGVTDAVIQPGYVGKSGIKLLLFLLLPVLYARWDREAGLKKLLIPEKRGLLTAAGLGIVIYGVILGAFFLFRNVFDFSGLTESLTATTGVSRENFLWTALYISFVNSLLEEFFFRGFAFLILRKYAGERTACLFSAGTFALYHIAMMIGWFGLPVILLTLAGLFAGGVIFNLFDRKSGNIFLSWLVHMFANFATNTIGFILFAA